MPHASAPTWKRTTSCAQNGRAVDAAYWVVLQKIREKCEGREASPLAQLTAVVRNFEPYHKSDDKPNVLNGGGSIFPVTAVGRHSKQAGDERHLPQDVSFWLCCKNSPRTARNVTSPFLLSLSRHSKQAGDEGDLPSDVSFAYPSDLSLANHVHDLVSLQRSSCCFKRKEAHPGLDKPFDEAMVLLDQVIQVFDLPQFDTLRKDSGGFELCNRLGIRRVLIDVDHAGSRLSGVGISRNCKLGYRLFGRTSLRRGTRCRVQCFHKEAFGRLGIARRTQQKLQGVAFRIACPIEIHPGFSDFDVGLVDFPGVVAGFELRPTPLVQLLGIALY